MAVDPENMTDEEIADFNKKEAEKAAKRKARQEKNRAKKLEVEERDTSIIRGIDGEDPIRVVCIRRIGLTNNEMSEEGEELDIPKEIAIKLQDAGAIKIKL